MSTDEHPPALGLRTTEAIGKPAPRKSCNRCERPASVCLCASLPSEPLVLAGKVVVLQHPHEHRKRMATVPLLQKCVAGVEVLRCRTYRPDLESHTPLHKALADAAAGRYPLLVLFPGGGARDLQQLAAELHADGGAALGPAQLPVGCPKRHAKEQGEQEAWRQQGAQQGMEPCQQGQQHLEPPQHRDMEMREQEQDRGRQQPGQGQQRQQPLYTLLVIDGTWKQAKEMYRAVLPLVLPPGGPGIRVQLPLPPRRDVQQLDVGAEAPQRQAAGGNSDLLEGCIAAAAAAAAAGEPSAAKAAAAAAAAAAGDEAPLLLRTEPMEGCLTTCEAAARALGWLEGPVRGPAVKDAVMQPLAALARFQARWDPALAVRLSDGAHYSQARCRMGMGKQGVLELIP